MNKWRKLRTKVVLSTLNYVSIIYLTISYVSIVLYNTNGAIYKNLKWWKSSFQQVYFYIPTCQGELQMDNKLNDMSRKNTNISFVNKTTTFSIMRALTTTHFEVMILLSSRRCIPSPSFFRTTWVLPSTVCKRGGVFLTNLKVQKLVLKSMMFPQTVSIFYRVIIELKICTKNLCATNFKHAVKNLVRKREWSLFYLNDHYICVHDIYMHVFMCEMSGA